MEKKIVLRAVYSFIDEYANVDYDGLETSGEGSDKKVFFDKVEDLINFCIKNKFELSYIGSQLLVVTDTENPEDCSIFGPVAYQDI